VPLLENGEIGRWFEANGWNYPVRGIPANGVAGVQQFFESMGLSKPPTVQLSQTEVLHTCKFPQSARGQVVLQTSSKKWVYASVESDAAWLKVLTPAVSGPQQAQIGYEIDVLLVPPDKTAEGHLAVRANSDQKLTLRVAVQVERLKPSLSGRVYQAIVTCAFAFLLMRLLLVPVVDVYGRSVAASEALARISSANHAEERPRLALGEWLKLPWTGIYLDPKPELLDEFLDKASPANVDRTRDFRDYYTSLLLRIVVSFTWWIGAVAGAYVLMRRGNSLDALWGFVAGGAAGIAVSATIGSLVMVGDLGPHFLWDKVLRGTGNGLLMLPLWVLLTLAWWTGLGAAFGIALAALGPLGRWLLDPLQHFMRGCCRLVGLRRFELE